MLLESSIPFIILFFCVQILILGYVMKHIQALLNQPHQVRSNLFTFLFIKLVPVALVLGMVLARFSSAFFLEFDSDTKASVRDAFFTKFTSNYTLNNYNMLILFRFVPFKF